jgi:release factor glutamine methyltransferase
MRIVTLPGVFSPISDTWLLARTLRDHLAERPDARVLDACTGSGALAVSAALAGAREVAAVDVSRRAVLTARLNARLNGVRVRAVRSDLLSALGDERFDVIVSNPPYVPAERDDLPRTGPERAWDAGRDGRALLDRLLAEAPAHLRPGGALLVVHSEICGSDATLEGLRAAGLEAEVAARHRGPLGPLMRARVEHLVREGLLAPGRDEEEVVVVRGQRPDAAPSAASASAYAYAPVAGRFSRGAGTSATAPAAARP